MTRFTGTVRGLRDTATFELLWLALPIVAMTVSRMMMGLIDVYMVSKLGTNALAAISPASLFVFVLACLGLGIANAVQTFVAQADGRGEPRQAGGYAWQTWYIAAAFALLTIPAAATTEVWFMWIARLGQHTPAVAALEIDYTRIAMWSIAPSIVCVGLNGFYNGVQKPWVTVVAVVASLGANVLGNWLLIYGNLGFPRLGIAGAAYSTVIAWCVRAVILGAALLLPAFDRTYNTRRSWRFSWKKTAGLIRVGGPMSLGWLIDIGTWAVFMIVIMPWLGTAAMAATNIGLQLMHLSFMPAIGIGIALCSQVGFAIGKGRPEQAYRRSRVAFRLTVIYMGLVGLVFWLAPSPLIHVFSRDPAVVEAGRLILIWAAVFQVFDAMNITYVSALRGAGDTRWTAVVTAIYCITVFIGGGVAMARFAPSWGVNGPWSMCTLYVIILGLTLLWRWRGGRWRNIRLFDEDRATQQADRPVEDTPTDPAADEEEALSPGAPRDSQPIANSDR